MCDMWCRLIDNAWCKKARAPNDKTVSALKPMMMSGVRWSICGQNVLGSRWERGVVFQFLSCSFWKLFAGTLLAEVKFVSMYDLEFE